MNNSIGKKKFVSINIETLKNTITDLPFDLFIFINGKYLKLARKGENFSEGYERYSQKGLNVVFVDQIHLNALSADISIKDLSFKKGEIRKEVYFKAEELRETLEKLGACLDVTQCERLAQNALDMMFESKDFFKLFLVFMERKNNEYEKALMTSFGCVLILTTFQWISEKIMNKVVFSSLVADISLVGCSNDNHKQFDENDIGKENLDGDTLWHSMRTKELLQNFFQNDISTDILKIVEFHHEGPGGTGYPFGRTEDSIPVLAAVYMVSREFLIELGKHETPQIEKIQLALEEKFQRGTFKKAVDGLFEQFS